MTEWREVKITTEGDDGNMVVDFTWKGYDDLYVRMEDGQIFSSHDQGETWQGINTAWYRRITILWRIKSWWYQSRWNRLTIRARYILTGSCGMNCGQEMFETARGMWVDGKGGVFESHFVPEADCPVHDIRDVKGEEWA